MDGKKFLKNIAKQLLHDFEPTKDIKVFTKNSAVIGAYAEGCVRKFVADYVSPLRVCTGAVISEQLCTAEELNPKKMVPQIDTIIWSPSPAPAIFATGDFGLVPRGSAFGILEIKRSAYSGVSTNLANFLNQKKVFNLVADICKSHYLESLQNAENNDSGEQLLLYPCFPALGVIVMKEPKQKISGRLNELIKKGFAVVLFEYNGNKLKPNAEAIHRFVNFLANTRFRAKFREGQERINIGLLCENDIS